jgi:hypothetical protein
MSSAWARCRSRQARRGLAALARAGGEARLAISLGRKEGRGMISLRTKRLMRRWYWNHQVETWLILALLTAIGCALVIEYWL